MIKHILAAAILVPFLFSCESITNLILSDEDEVAMGNKFKAEILADSVQYPQYKATTADRADVINYINTMGQKLAKAQKDRKNMSFTFTLIDNDTMINAFAVPGGHVFVYTGLLKAAQSGAEVAGVIAHEVGHIAMRHGASRLVEAYGITALTQMVFGTDSSAAGKIAEICTGLLFLKFSRDDEYQADSCAVAFTTAAQYNPIGMKNFFETLKAKYGGGMGAFEVLATHPDTDKRISEVQRIIAKTSGAPQNSTDWMYTAEYAAIKVKI